MSQATRDRNLLFGILALQMDFVRRDDLIAAMNAWVLDKARPLGQILCDRGALADDQRGLLDSLVQAHLKQHGNDAQHSLAAASALRPVRDDLRQIADPEVQSTLESMSTALPGTQSGILHAGNGSCRYRRLRPHAHGGLGEVYLAEDTELHREVALKEIRANRADDPESRSRFVVEAEITGGLEHPGIVPVYGLGVYPDGRPYYAMRFIRGDSLKAAVEKFHAADKSDRDPCARRLAFRQLLRRFVDACNAVAYAHSRGVLHRDLKPANIMLGKFGETLVVDWGLAKAGVRRAPGEVSAEQTTDPTFRPGSGSDLQGTQDGVALGTPTYMSPEQAAGKLDQVSAASDIYSLGATLYVLLTGHRPFKGDTPEDVLGQVRSGRPISPRAVKTDVPAALDAICRKAMAFRPSERYATALELAGDVDHWLADEPVSAYAEPWPARASRWARRHRTAVVSAGVLLASAVVALSASTTVVWREQRKTSEQKRLAEQNFGYARDLSYNGVNLVAQAGASFAATPALQASRKQLLTTAAVVFRDYLDQQPNNPELRQQAAFIFRYAANVHGFENEIGAADPLYREAAELLDGLTGQFPDDVGYRKALGEVLRDYAAVQSKVGRLREAGAGLERAVAIAQEQAEAEPTLRAHRLNLAIALLDLASVDYARGQVAVSRQSATRAEAYFRELSQRPPAEMHPYTPVLLATALHRLAILARDAGEFEQADARHREAAQLLQGVLQKPSQHVVDADVRHFLARCRLEYGKTLARKPERRKNAADNLNFAVAQWEKLAAAFPNVPLYREWLGVAFQARGQYQADATQWQEARSDYARSRELLAAEVARSPDLPAIRGDLGRTYAGLARVARAAGDSAAADEATSRAVAALEFAVARSPDNAEDRKSLADARASRLPQ